MHCAIAQVIVTQPLICAVHNTSTNSDALTWDMAVNNPCGAFVGYVIYRATSPAGPFLPDTVITDQNATSWADLKLSGSNNWFYYVKDSFSCPGASYQIADTLENESNPNIPPLYSVTVNPDSTITLTWLPSSSPQATFYIIYNQPPAGLPTIIDTVYGRLNTTWTDSNIVLANPYASSIGFTVAAGANCLGETFSSYNTKPLFTILLTHSEARCNPAIPLTWTAYSNMPGGLGGYQVYVSRNDSAYALVATVDSATLQYNYTTFNNGDSVQIAVVAFNNDTTILASSNYERFIATVIKPPAYVYLSSLSVDTSNNHVDIRWIVDNNAKVYEYQVYNSEDSINWVTIPDANNGVQQVPVPVARFSMYIDSTVQPQYGPYYYYVQAYDSCMTFTNTPLGEVVSLQGTLSDYYQITLTWNSFVLYGATVQRYDLYRDIGNGMVFDRSFSPGVTSCIDSVFQDTASIGQFCYLIQAAYTLHLPLANNYDTSEISFSNITCVDHRPIIYIPNAFVYNGVNNFFKPRIIFGDPAGYSMSIFDRYGGKIFETHDVNTAWDGTRNGSPVDQGGYAYLITFTALDGTPVTRSGIVMFLKK